MTIRTPEQLVDEFKRTGEFDRLRRELLASFQRHEDLAAFSMRIEEVSRQRLASDSKLLGLPQESALRELSNELDRYPLIERAIADMTTLSDPAFASGIKTSAERMLRERNAEKDLPGTAVTSAATSVPSSILRASSGVSTAASGSGSGGRSSAK